MADEYLIPVNLLRMSNSFLVVKLRAKSRQEAERRARDHVREAIEDDNLEVPWDCFDCTESRYEEDGIAEVHGSIEDYTVDIDLMEEPTDAEREHAARQQPLLQDCAAAPEGAGTEGQGSG